MTMILTQGNAPMGRAALKCEVNGAQRVHQQLDIDRRLMTQFASPPCSEGLELLANRRLRSTPADLE